MSSCDTPFLFKLNTEYPLISCMFHFIERHNYPSSRSRYHGSYRGNALRLAINIELLQTSLHMETGSEMCSIALRLPEVPPLTTPISRRFCLFLTLINIKPTHSCLFRLATTRLIALLTVLSVTGPVLSTAMSYRMNFTSGSFGF
jgi:hypothetical protein